MAEDKAVLIDRIQKYIAKGEWGRAFVDLQKLNELLKGKDLRVRMKIAEALARMGKKESAIKEYLEVADEYALQGFTVQAIAINKIIVKIDPTRDDVYKRLGELQRERGLVPDIMPRVQAAPVKEQPSTSKQPHVPATPLFSDLTVDELAYLSRKMNAISVPAGSYVFREGDSGDSIFIVTSGSVKILSRNKKGDEIEVVGLKEGDFFGEFGYFSNARREASAIAVTDSEILELSKEIINDVTAKHPRMKEVLLKFYKYRVVDKLMAISPLFSKISVKDRLEILQKFTYHSFDPGVLIIQEGCPGDYLYLIKSGKADVVAWREDQEMLLATIGEGEFFGEISLVTGEPRTASVRARIYLEVMRLSKADILDVQARHQSVKDALDEMVKKRTEDTEKIVLDMKQLWENGLV